VILGRSEGACAVGINWDLSDKKTLDWRGKGVVRGDLGEGRCLFLRSGDGVNLY